MLRMYARAYPFRKRLERNLHPYTKLVWTDPSELLSSRNSRRDPSVLEESQAGNNSATRESQAYMNANIDDLEDEDYIPGSPDELVDERTQLETENIDIDIDIGSLSFKSPRNRIGTTYRHLASRRRHRQRGTSSKRPRYAQRVVNPLDNNHGQNGYASDLADIGPDQQLPSISSLLGPGGIDSVGSRSNNDGDDRLADPFDVPRSGDLRIHNRPNRLGHGNSDHSHQIQLYSDLSSSSLDEQPGVPADDLALPRLYSNNSGTIDVQRSASISRQSSMDTDSRLYSSPSNEPSRILRARKGTTNNLLRRQIRGVLPFSFMRDVSMDNLNEGEDGGRSSWNRDMGRNNNRRRVLTSSSSDDNSVVSDNDSDSDVLLAGRVLDKNIHGYRHDHAGADTIANMFSDPVSSLPTDSLPIRNEESRSSFGHSHFRFNFMDIYEWQYPPLAPAESIGLAPDFLRVAARECKRRGVCAKSTHDDPFRKRITIEPRTEMESRHGDDVARSILMSWKLGVIDVRRVYFCDDEYEQSDGPMSDDGNMGIALDAFSDNGGATEQQLDRLPSPILVSDGEAIEDNRTYDTLARSRRYKQTSNRGNRQHHMLKQPRHRRQQKLVSGNRAKRAFFDLKRSSRNPHSAQPIEQRTPLAQRLGSVMNEFAALDSDSDTATPNTPRQDRLTRPASHSTRDHIHRTQQKSTRQESLVNRFHRQQRPHQQLSLNVGRSRSAYKHSDRSDHPHRADNAIFIFDDDMSRPSGRDVSRKAGLRQTKLLPSRSMAASSLSSSTRIGGARVDSLAEKIGQRRLNPQNSGRKVQRSAQSQVRKWSSAAGSRSRSTVQRKAVPTRVNITQSHNTIRGIEGGFGQIDLLDANNSNNQSETCEPVMRAPFVSNGGARSLRCFHSGMQFGYRMWISNGGLRRTIKRLCSGLNPVIEKPATSVSGANARVRHSEGEDHPAYANSVFYAYSDILRIELSATPQEFIQAYTTLLILWYEALVLTEHNGDQTRDVDDSVEADVLRWIEFAQQYILATMRSKPALVQLVRGTVECVHDGILKLKQLAVIEDCNTVGAACIGLSFAVVMLQLALAVASVRNNTGSAGPRAVGEYDEMPMELEPGRFGPEVDKCLLVMVKLLSNGAQRHDPFRLGHTEQLWVAMLHIFSSGGQDASSKTKDKRHHTESDSGGMLVSHYGNEDDAANGLAQASAIARVSGVWHTVRRVCNCECDADSRRAESLWSAFVYLLPLSQISDEGIAAPRVALSKRSHLASIAETAVEKQLVDCLKRRNGSKQLRALDEALVRQAFVRIHSTVVDHGIGFEPNSHVYITLYRYLESNGFSSLSIEPLPSLPRFFTRYCGSIKREASLSDTCAVLWLKALDLSLGEWNAQLSVLQPSSKPYRHLLRNVRSAVSKMLPTRILTFDSSGSRAQLSTLANYYAVFLFFLHAMPSGVVRSVRLFTQFQLLLKFKESTSPIARRVYFEAWSAAAMIVARNLRQTLEINGSAGGLVQQLVSKCATLPDVKDYYDALAMTVNSWGESVGTVISDCLASGQQGTKSRPDTSWNQADVAFMYLQRVLTGEALANHAPVTLIIVLSVLRQPFLVDVAANNNASGFGNADRNARDGNVLINLNTALLERLLEVIRIWQDAVLGTSCSVGSSTVNREDELGQNGTSKGAATVEGEDNSQAGFAAFDSTELLEVTAEVEEIERQASFAAVDMEILQLVHEKYIPALRLRIMLTFSSLSATSQAAHLALVPSQQQARTLVATVSILARMVSACVDAGMRAWESFFEEHGRESLHLVPDRRGRRLVLVLFALFVVNVLRSKGQSTQRLDMVLKDIWFACVCDLELLPYVHRLAAALWFKDKTGKEMGSVDGCSLAVFANIPADRRLVDSKGMVDERHLAARMRSGDAEEEEEARATSIEAYEDRATLVISLVDGVLQDIGRSTGGTAMPLHTRQVLASWVDRLLDSARTIKNESERVRFGLVDTRKIVSAMSERVTLLVRSNCAELIHSMNIPL
ncbi:hypothetical protein EV175_001661 [Coemansia sp. RSA 1933]|nr:hypothetical protein EV175_001661 [Coemansia sp. RSA 1933]